MSRGNYLVSADREMGFRGGLRRFVKMAWPIVEPSQPLVWNWHVDLICDHLEAVSRKEISLLAINIPPGHMKSSLCSVFWPAWEWIRQNGAAAHTRMANISFDASLTLRDSGKTLDLIQSEWFKARWGDVCAVEGSTARGDYENTKTGHRFTSSIGGRITGRHFDIIVVDDPHKPASISDISLQEVQDYFSGTLPTRFKNPADARIVLTMQRLHQRDATEVMKEMGATIVALPARYEPTRAYSGPWGADPRTDEGELLFPERFPEKVVSKLETTMGSMNAAAQLQQRPAPEGGLVFKAEWMQTWMVLPDRFDRIIQSWDFAFKDTAGADFVVGQVWGRKGADFYLLDQYRERADFEKSVKAVKRMTEKWPKAITKLVEAKANGPAIVAHLRKAISGFLEIEPEGGKVARANAVQPLFEAKNVWHPSVQTHPWITQHVEELTMFPNAAHDDTVDACTQALAYMHANRTAFLEAMNAIE